MSNQHGMPTLHLTRLCAMPLAELHVFRPGAPLKGSLSIANLAIAVGEQLALTPVELQLFDLVDCQACFGSLGRMLAGSSSKAVFSE